MTFLSSFLGVVLVFIGIESNWRYAWTLILAGGAMVAVGAKP